MFFFILVGITGHKKVESPSEKTNIDVIGTQKSEKPGRLQPNTERPTAQEEQSQPPLTGFGSTVVEKPTTSDSSSPANLNEVVSLLKDGKATTLQKKQLFGKWYTGTILIKDVVSEDSEDQAKINIIVGVKEGSSGSQDNFIEMSFETGDIEKTVKLRKGSHAIVTGKLVAMTIRRTMYMGIGDVEVFHFQDVKIDESSGLH